MSYQREYSKRIKAGIVGVGSHSYRNILPAMNFLPVEISAICDINEDLGIKTAKQYGCKYYKNSADMYEKENLEAVFISVGPRLHPKLVIEALDYGVNVWVEKPLAMRAYEVEQIIEHRNDNIVVVGLKKAFMPVTEKSLEIVNSEKYGKLKSILAVYPMSIPGNGEEVLAKMEFTNWLGNGVHPLSFVIAIGGKVKSVTSQLGMDGHGALIIQFANGITGNLHLASGPQPIEMYNLYGENWHLHIYNSNYIKL